jgi:hypothetical protein
MSTHIVTVRVERTLNRLYPIGSDTPIPESAVVSIEADPLADLPNRSNLRVGDVVLDATGMPFVIDTRKDPGFGWLDVLHAYRADTLDDSSVTDLEAPISLLARNGEPIEGVMFR